MERSRSEGARGRLLLEQDLPQAPSPTVRKRGRPKILRVTLPLTAYADMGRRERENFRRHIADILNDTDAAAGANYWRVKMASLALEPYGITLVPNDRVLHVHQEWPHQVRRKVSGSVWDGRKPIWRRPTVSDHPHKLGKLTNGPKIRCAHRSWKSAEQLTAAARAPFKPRGDDAEAAHALLTAIGHLATPATKRARSFLDGEVNKAIKAKRDLLGDLEQPCSESAWLEIVIPKRVYRVSTAPLKCPDVSNSAPFEAAARLWNWAINARRREQMRTKWPQLAFHGECCRLDRSALRSFPDDLGGQCCRWWTCGEPTLASSRRSAPKKTCPLACWIRKKRKK
jgi:hypothetical protein